MLDADAFARRFGQQLSGITVPDKQEIVVNEEQFTLNTIRHELFHAALDGMCLTSARLKRDQLEEVSCEVYATYGTSLNRLARQIYNHFR